MAVDRRLADQRKQDWEGLRVRLGEKMRRLGEVAPDDYVKAQELLASIDWMAVSMQSLAAQLAEHQSLGHFNKGSRA